MMAQVVSLSRASAHQFSKAVVDSLDIVAGEGVAGDAHRGVTVKHRSRVAADPTQPNLRQVHLLQAEILRELAEKGFDIKPGDIGENILTRGVDLLGLPRGTLLVFGDTVILEVTGLRNPCVQLDEFKPGLMRALLDRRADGGLVRKAGIMSIVRRGGAVRTGDAIRITLPPEPHEALDRV
ncbi:hypothetical protein MCEMSEM23_01314 [Rhabdaerophilaceae bacterium]